MGRDPGKAKQETTKTADHMSTESDKSPNGVCSFVFDFQGFCVVCSGWPEPRKSKQKQKNNTADHMSTESDKSPNGVCSFVFLIFKVFAWPAPDGQNLENPKNKKDKTADHMSTESDKSINGVCSFLFLIFEVFAWSAPDGQNLENTKTPKPKLQTTCPQSQTRAPMGSAVLFFFPRFLHGLLQMARTSKIKKNKTADPIGALV